MSKLILILLIFFAKPLFASFIDEDVAAIPMGIGYDFKKDKPNISDFTIIRYSNYGFGWEFVKFNFIYMKDDQRKLYVSIINPAIFWNFLDDTVLGAFILINYAPNFDFENVVAFTGIRYALPHFNDFLRALNLNIESGYRYINKKRDANSFYVNVKFSPIFFIESCKIGCAKKQKKENANE